MVNCSFIYLFLFFLTAHFSEPDKLFKGHNHVMLPACGAKDKEMNDGKSVPIERELSPFYKLEGHGQSQGRG